MKPRLLLGGILFALVALAGPSFAGDLPNPAARSPALELCANGHPKRRPLNVTYGGLPLRHGYERDHRLPLCLGGPDSVENVWYQPVLDASIKDEMEREACEAVCRGDVSLARAQSLPQFHRGYWRGDPAGTAK